MAFLTILGILLISSSILRLVLEEKAGWEIPESSRLEFTENIPANNFRLINAEDNKTGSKLGLRQRFVLLLHIKEAISMSDSNSKSYWKPWRQLKLCLILFVRIYKSVPVLIHAQNSEAAAKAPKSKMSSNVKLLKKSQNYANQHKNNQKLSNEKVCVGYPPLSLK